MSLRAPYFLRSRVRRSVPVSADDAGACDDVRDPDYVPSVDGDNASVIIVENTPEKDEDVIVVDDYDEDTSTKSTKFMQRVFEFLKAMDADGVSLDEFVVVSGSNRLTLGDWKQGTVEDANVVVVEDDEADEDWDSGSEIDDAEKDPDYVPSDDESECDEAEAEAEVNVVDVEGDSVDSDADEADNGSDSDSDSDYVPSDDESDDDEVNEVVDDQRTPRVLKTKANRLSVRFPRTPAKTLKSRTRFQFPKTDHVVKRLFKKKNEPVPSADDEANDPDWEPTAEDAIQEREDEQLDREVSARFSFEKDVKRARTYIKSGGKWRDTCLMEYLVKFRRGRMDYADFSWAMITSTAMSEFTFISKQAPTEGLRSLGSYISDTRSSPHKISVNSSDWSFLRFNHPQAVTLIEELADITENHHGVIIDFGTHRHHSRRDD